ncbi:sigma-70 family RNA polymerase sigma factor [Pelagicoccus sp. SDUM812002]|uniref:sigma-70 family RNA polymerase sigma factor n=1 Tax=Pelagicoccus sp. SDUM812002 TaxID=3041266 RepID=UPI00280E5F1C|nr:sigma-70 family RNA polymerase sigma factor [Pelagicoccus sp. SDUM812002]MDQ8187623.1 sigma-70 family RNA polymerase sigma factor [Pelagicoccus sp. SDUM812002]
MPTIAHSPAKKDPTSTAPLQVARFRTALDWMIAHPKWEDHWVCSVNELRYKGRRQGINQRNALRSLPLERKQELIRHALGQELPAPSFSEARRLARHWGVTQYRARSDFGRPSLKEWQALQQKVLLRISARYEQYKESQSELFKTFQHLPIEGALASCNRTSQREDACQEARLALLEAIDRIEPSENFEAYARQWIKRRVLNFIMQERVPVKAPINMISKSIRGDKGANPNLAKAIREGTVQLDHPDSPQSSGDPSLVSEQEDSPHRTAMKSDEFHQLSLALAQLTKKQREVVDRRFGLGNHSSGQSLAQIAIQTGISRQQVYQREKRALHALKTNLLELAEELSIEGARSCDY